MMDWKTETPQDVLDTAVALVSITTPARVVMDKGEYISRVWEMIPGPTDLGHSHSEPPFSAADVVLEYEDGECVAVPHGTRTLQFVEGRRNGEIPVAAMLISGSAAANNILTETTVRYTRFSENERERVRGKIEAERKLFFRFIPPQYRRDRGVTVEEDGTVVLCSDLLDAMRTGEYSWCVTHWKWNREARPVAFSQGRAYSHTSLGGWHYAIIWFYDQSAQKWLGWECYPRHRGTPVFWRVLNDPDNPDFVSDKPKDSAEFHTDPIFQGVSLEKFLGFISSVFWAEGEVKTPQEFATIMADRPYESWQGCAAFFAVPTPQNEWGWAYETVSGRQLIWLPGDTVFTRGLRESQNFRGTVEEVLGAVVDLAEPEWLGAALTLSLAVARPCVSEYSHEPSEAHNEGFFAAVNRKPFEVYGEAVKPPVAPAHSYDFYVAMDEEGHATREERVYNAFQVLRRSAAN